MGVKIVIIILSIVIAISGIVLLLFGYYKTERIDGQFIRTEDRLLHTGVHLAFVAEDGSRVQLKNIDELPDIDLTHSYIVEVKIQKGGLIRLGNYWTSIYAKKD